MVFLAFLLVLGVVLLAVAVGVCFYAYDQQDTGPDEGRTSIDDLLK